MEDGSTCDNCQTIKHELLEASVLDSLQHHLMDPALIKIFCEKHTRHRNKLAAEQIAGIPNGKSELVKISKELDRLVPALNDDLPGSRVGDKMEQLETRKAELEARLEGAQRACPAPSRRRGHEYLIDIGGHDT